MPTASQKLERLTGLPQTSYTSLHEEWFSNGIRATFALLKSAEGSVLDRFKKITDSTSSSYSIVDKEVLNITATYITTGAIINVPIISAQSGKAGAVTHSIFNDQKIPYSYMIGSDLMFSLTPNALVGPITKYTIYELYLPVFSDVDIMSDLIPELIDPVSHYAAYCMYMYRCGEFQDQMNDRTQDEDSELANLCMANINSSLQSAHEMFSLFASEIRGLGGNVTNITNWRKDGK